MAWPVRKDGIAWPHLAGFDQYEQTIDRASDTGLLGTGVNKLLPMLATLLIREVDDVGEQRLQAQRREQLPFHGVEDDTIKLFAADARPFVAAALTHSAAADVIVILAAFS